MTQFGMNGAMFDITIRSLKYALFDAGEFELDVAEQFNDEGTDWSIEENLSISRKMEQNDGLFWDGDSDAEGVLWGDALKVLLFRRLPISICRLLIALTVQCWLWKRRRISPNIGLWSIC